MRWRNTSTPTYAGNAGSGVGASAKPTVVERLEALDDAGNVCAALIKAVDGSLSFEVNGVTVSTDQADAGSTYEAAANSPADGVDTEFTFTGTPIMVFRNGVNETRLGTIAGSAFTFDSAPSASDDIEALI